MSDKKTCPSCRYQTFNVLNFGLTCGITFAFYVFFIVIIAWQFELGTGIVSLIRELYIGVDLSFSGALIGFFWTFLDTFIGGIIFAAVYNYLQHCKKLD